MSEKKSRIITEFAKAGWKLTDLQADQFVRYYELLVEWNEKMNLTAITEPKEIILKHSKDFYGSLNDSECMKLTGLSRNTYYKYKRELKNQKFFEPVDTNNGLCVTNAVECTITRKDESIGSIHIPVYFYLNRYGNSAINS